ncbi:LacI family DNA-binding transcriptional regulator [Propionibacteriaceae bacterium Y2011]
MRDVADRAGVSVATASRALRGDQPIAPATRDRVLEAVAVLDYRLLRSRRATEHAPNQIVVLTPSLRHLAVAEILVGVETASADSGHACPFMVTDSDPDRELRALERVATGRDVKAVIVVGGTHQTPAWRESLPGAVATLADLGVRVVFCGRALVDMDLPEVAVVDYENRAGAEAAVSVLLGKGHRRIGLLRGPDGFTTSEERAAGYVEALRAFGVRFDPDLVVSGPRSGPAGMARATDLITRRPDVTAIFADSDAQALGAMRAAHLRGLTVPGRLSVIGFDDEQMSSILTPALTTVHTPFIELGRRAAQAALGTDPELEPGRSLTLASHIVMRDSVGASTGQA